MKSTNRVDKAGEERQAVSVGWRSEQGDPSEMENYQDKKDEKDNKDFQNDNLGEMNNTTHLGWKIIRIRRKDEKVNKDFQKDNLGEMNNGTHLEWENAQMTIGQQ